jgi:hypothetical protein
MSRLGFLFYTFLFFALSTLRAETIDNRNFAIDTCYPTPNEIRLAEDRARHYWEKNAARFGSNPVYLAVKTSKLFPGEVQLLWPKLINSETTASFFSRGPDQQTYSSLELIGIMIFDTRTGTSWVIMDLFPSIRHRLGMLPDLTTISLATSDLVIGVDAI